MSNRARTRSGSDFKARTRSRTGSPISYTRSRSRSRSRRDRRRRSRSQSQEEEEEGHRLHVADLDSNASKRDLESLFGKYGSLIEVWMARSVPCFAFVVFKHREEALEACHAADGVEIRGRRVRVTVAKPRTRGRGRRGFDPSMRCYQCGQKGHFSRDCPDTKYGYKRPPSPRDGRRDDRGGYRREERDHYDRRDRGDYRRGSIWSPMGLSFIVEYG